MKPTANDFVLLGVIVLLGVSFYLERAVWDARHWDRGGLVLLMWAFFGATYLVWRVWS